MSVFGSLLALGFRSMGRNGVKRVCLIAVCPRNVVSGTRSLVFWMMGVVS